MVRRLGLSTNGRWLQCYGMQCGLRWITEKGMVIFILTGSVVVKDDEDGKSQIQHFGGGRIGRIVMRPMSLWESEDSNGLVSLAELFQTPERIARKCDLNLEDIAYLTCRGGWLDIIDMEKEVALDQAFDYVDVVAETDISAADNIQKNPEQVRRLLRSYARHQGTQAELTTKGHRIHDLQQGLRRHLPQGIEQNFVVEDMPAWNPNLRSKLRLEHLTTAILLTRLLPQPL